jgi:uncharacterized MAPEG superfamily protein
LAGTSATAIRRPSLSPERRLAHTVRTVNFLETFPFFAAAVLVVVLAKANSSQTALGAQLYFWGRLAHLPIYVIGIPYLRTLVWAVAFAGLVMVLGALF